MKNNIRVNQNELKESKKLALHYMTPLIDVARESFLILSSDLRVILANPIFYQTFQVSPEKTENRFIYELGNNQWNIPELKRLMEEILPEKKMVTDYEVTHNFETIGEKTMLLNAQQIDSVQLITLAIEDVTNKKQIEKQQAEYTKELEARVVERTSELSERIKELESVNLTMVGRELKMVELKKEIENLKKRVKNGNGNHKNSNGKNGH